MDGVETHEEMIMDVLMVSLESPFNLMFRFLTVCHTIQVRLHVRKVQDFEQFNSAYKFLEEKTKQPQRSKQIKHDQPDA